MRQGATMATTTPAARQLRTVPLSSIVALDGWNPRMSVDDAELQALSGSMVERGCLVPVIVQATGDGAYLVDGELSDERVKRKRRLLHFIKDTGGRRATTVPHCHHREQESQRSVDATVLIAGIFMLVLGLGATYYAIALIRNLHGFADKKLKHYVSYPGRGGWRRASPDDPSFRSSSEGTTLISFHYVPKTMRQVKRVGWVYLPAGLFVLFFGVLLTLAGVTGNVE